jgi:hypothetical protein
MGIVDLKNLQITFILFQAYGIECKPNKQSLHS